MKSFRLTGKGAIALVASTLLLGSAIGGTMAWLTAETNAVTNTFTVGNINIALTETTGNEYDFVPGDKIAKDPKVTVTAGSEACYLFVKVTDVNNIVSGTQEERIVNWTVDTEIWTAVPDHNGYWYKEVDASEQDQNFYVLTDEITDDAKTGSVTVSENVTKEMVTTINNAKPKITIDAAAVQMDNVESVANAWNNLPTEFKS